MKDIAEMTQEERAELLRALSEANVQPAKAGEVEPDQNALRVSVDGIDLSIDRRAVKDIRTFRLIGEVEQGGSRAPFAAVELLDFLLGDEQRRAVEKELADEDGFVDSDKYMILLVKLLNSPELKN